MLNEKRHLDQNSELKNRIEKVSREQNNQNVYQSFIQTFFLREMHGQMTNKFKIVF